MDYIALLTLQLTDLFRIGLLAALFFTMERTRAQTGVLVPLVGGVVFVAVIIATTMPRAGVETWVAVATGVVANAVIVGVMWGIWSVVKRRG